MSIDPGVTPVRVTAGVDWAKDDHAVCVAGDQGEVLERFTVRHDAAGLKRMAARLLRTGAGQIGIERSDGPVAGTLLQAGLTVFVIPPAQVKNLRSRYGSAGNKDDRFDAYVLADVVRTDVRRLRPMARDSDQTSALRTSVRARRDLVGHRVAAANQLRAHLQIVFPAAATLFASIDSAITLTFLDRFTTQEQADWLSPRRLAAWLASAACSGGTGPCVLHARLMAAPRGATGQYAQHPRGNHARPGSHPAHAEHPDSGPGRQHRRAARRPPRRRDLHIPAPRRHCPRRPPARRDRRRTRTLPHPRLPDLPGRSRALHPAVGQGQVRHVPLGSRQAAPRRPVRLRRRLPPGQPLGHCPLRQGHRTRLRPPPRRAHPRPSLDARHLALLAGQPPLRPRRPQQPPGTPQPRSTSCCPNRGLTQGNSCRARKG